MVSVTMPQLGESVTEGTITRWLKQEGDQVQADEPLLEVSTDKVDTEIPSPAAGTLTKIVAAVDETVEVGAELAVIGGADDAAGEAPAAAAPKPPVVDPPSAAPPAPAPAPEAPVAAAPAPEAPSAPAAAPAGDTGSPVLMPALG